MLHFTVLNVLTLGFLALTIFEQKLLQKITITKSSQRISSTRPLYLMVFIILVFIATLIFLLTADESIVHWYIRGVFSFLLIIHVRLLTLGKPWQVVFITILASVILIYLRFTTQNDLLHNLLLLFSVVWVGPFLVKLGMITLRRFIILSVIWMLYDIGFVWLTPGASVIEAVGQEIGFQLAIVSGKSFIGSGDLLWASVFVSVIKSERWKYSTAIVLVGVNLLFGLIDYLLQNKEFFPLLVLWVPVGLGLIYLQKNPESKLFLLFRQFVPDRRSSKNKDKDQK